MRKTRFVVIGVLLMLVTAGVALAAGDYGIGRSVVSTGGGERASDNFMVRDVIGEAAVGISLSESFLLRAGFVTYTAPSVGICGDVDCDGSVTMNDGRQIFMNLIYGEELYPLCDPWAADCDGAPGITMNDGRQIFMNLIYGADDYPLVCD